MWLERPQRWKVESFGAAGRRYPGAERENMELLVTRSTAAEF